MVVWNYSNLFTEVLNFFYENCKCIYLGDMLRNNTMFQPTMLQTRV